MSYFNVEKPETAISRWSRARTRAAKVFCQLRNKVMFISFVQRSSVLNLITLIQVGKGLSKCEKAQKLALQHWLEAVSSYSDNYV